MPHLTTANSLEFAQQIALFTDRTPDMIEAQSDTAEAWPDTAAVGCPDIVGA